MELESLRKRNEDTLNILLKELKIKITYQELLEEFTSMFISTDLTLKRIRLIGVQNMYDFEENGNRVKVPNQTKRTQIYVLTKKEFEAMDHVDLNTVMSKLTFLKNLYYQNLYLKNILDLENYMEALHSFKYIH